MFKNLFIYKILFYFLFFNTSQNQIFCKNIRILKEETISKKAKIYFISILLVLIVILILIFGIYKSIKIKKQINSINNNNENLSEIDSKKKNYIIKNKFKSFIYSKDFLFNKCSICLLNFVENKSPIFMTPCGHLYHKYCLKKYFLTDVKNNTCPVCKFNFFNLIKDEKFNFNKVKIISFNENENPDKYTNLNVETEISFENHKTKNKILQ